MAGPATISRILGDMAVEKLLTPDQAELAEDSVLATVMSRAQDVIGDRERALRWMGTPIRALGYSAPISMLNTVQGEQAVLTILGRLEHGIA